MTTKLDCHGRTDIGKRREQNQDQYLIADLRRLMNVCESSLPRAEHQKLVGDTPGKLLIVADGMGGHTGGAKASTMAVTTMTDYVLNMMHWFLKLSQELDDEFQDELAAALTACERDIRTCGNNDPHFSHMGTTLTMAYIVWPRMYIVHAGDSRCYLLRDAKLEQITTDHSMAQLLIDSGNKSSKDQASKRHVLWNAIGGNQFNVKADVGKVLLKSGDTILLCSDGLHGAVDATTIVDILGKQNVSVESKTQRLIEAANDAGGRDNITAVVAHCDGPPKPTEECISRDEGGSITVDELRSANAPLADTDEFPVVRPESQQRTTDRQINT